MNTLLQLSARYICSAPVHLHWTTSLLVPYGEYPEAMLWWLTNRTTVSPDVLSPPLTKLTGTLQGFLSRSDVSVIDGTMGTTTMIA